MDTDDINRMIVEIMTGKERTLKTPEAQIMWDQLKKECDEIVAKGGIVDVAPEIPEL